MAKFEFYGGYDMRDKNNQPLFLVGGASGTGKTEICKRIAETFDGVVALDADILWGNGIFSPEDTRPFYETWLKLSRNIALCGRPVALFNAGMGVPDNIEGCEERKKISNVYYLILYCSDEEQEKRLRKRAEWNENNPMTDRFIKEMQGLNGFFKNCQYDNISLKKIDTTTRSIEETTLEVIDWIHANIQND